MEGSIWCQHKVEGTGDGGMAQVKTAGSSVMSRIRPQISMLILGVTFSKPSYALSRTETSHQPPKNTASVSKQSRQLTEILDAKKVSTTNSDFLWMTRTSIQLLCPSTLPNRAHDGGTVIGVYLPLDSNHTNNYLPRRTDNTLQLVT